MAFNQIKYQDDYNKNKYKMYQFRIKKNDNYIITYLDGLSNKNAYLINLIENDLNVYSLKQIKSLVKPIFEKYKINDVYLFGSYARGEANKDSDIDIYCDRGEVKTLIDLGHLEDDLKEVLQKNVDIVFESSEMDAYFKKQIMEDLIKLC